MRHKKLCLIESLEKSFLPVESQTPSVFLLSEPRFATSLAEARSIRNMWRRWGQERRADLQLHRVTANSGLAHFETTAVVVLVYSTDWR